MERVIRMGKKKLIEGILPLNVINDATSREKKIRHGHPSTLHYWWARRPLAAARAVIWASLVDDPSSHPEVFPTEEAQEKERERLYHILEELVKWENSNNQEVLNAAKAEILKSTDNNPPAILDPFAGGGAIPLEAQRLGLEAHAHDLNPVAVMINKAMIEIPPEFSNQPPVNPDSRTGSMKDIWSGSAGLAEDVRYYGEWMKEEAYRRIGRLYPKVKVPKEQGGGEATVIAWIWARTVKCPNPACGCEMPLVKSFVLSRKKGNEAWIDPVCENGKIHYYVRHSGKPKIKETENTSGARCVKCNTSVSFDYIRNEGKEHRMGARLMAVVAEGQRRRIYLSPDSEQIQAADVEMPSDAPDADLPEQALGFRVQQYGMKKYKDLFTPRQLTALTVFSSLVNTAQKKAEKDAITAGLDEDRKPLRDGGFGAKAYGEAVGVYLSFVVDKLADYNSSVCSWHNSGEKIRNTFGKQTISMTWDYAEANPFSNSSGCYDNMLNWVYKCIMKFPASISGCALQFNAEKDCGLCNVMVSTDPPYYDNIGYADLSDFFYIWMRRSLKDTYPDLFNTMLTPKSDELIMAPYRHEGSKKKAKQFFEDGMLKTCRQIYQYARDDIPVTIYYAYKQSDKNAGSDTSVSSGWETMLNAIIRAGFRIVRTWPIQTELANRQRSKDSNALTSSIVLVCRKRQADAPKTTRRDFVNTLHRKLKPALEDLRNSNIAPVDMAQSAIGPGMEVFSSYSQVLESDGSPVSVRSALRIINEELDRYNHERIGDMDAGSSFCVDMYTQFGYNDAIYGEVEKMANGKNISMEMLASRGVLYARSGKVHLLKRDEIPEKTGGKADNIWLLAQQFTHALDKGGVSACAEEVASVPGSSAESARQLVYSLFEIAEKKNWTEDALVYNSLVTSWQEIQSRAAEIAAEQKNPNRQMSFFD